MDDNLIVRLHRELDKIKKPKTFMEICGTHTNEIGKIGLRNILQGKVKLISGPGCPVCVTASKYIDYIYALSVFKNIGIITYGDMIRVPGSRPNINLMNARALGAEVHMVYSAIDSLKIAQENPSKEYVFLAIGFETTIPATCILLNEVINRGINNLKIMSLHKKVEPVMRELLKDDLNIDGFLCPGNVAVILGEDGFEFLEKENMLGVIAGFTEEEILRAIITLINKSNNNEVGLFNEYKSVVNKEGNIIAKEYFNEFFELKPSLWRGLGVIDNSGFELNNGLQKYEIKSNYTIEETINLIKKDENKYICRCGDVLKGKITPLECESFKKICNPSFPIGPCMVSNEGTCGAYYKYERR